MRELVGMSKVIEELVDREFLAITEVSSVSKAWEDNKAALKHAITSLPRLNPRTKNIGIKYHWFKSKSEPGNGIECHPISTKEQKTDILTKGLTKLEFEEKRKMLMRW